MHKDAWTETLVAIALDAVLHGDVKLAKRMLQLVSPDVERLFIQTMKELCQTASERCKEALEEKIK